MRRLLLSLATASAIFASASVVPASAMTLGSAPALQAALADQVQDAAYTCRHRFYTSRRLCWWRPDFHRWHWRWRRHW